MVCNRRSLAKRKREEQETTSRSVRPKTLFTEGASTSKASPHTPSTSGSSLRTASIGGASHHSEGETIELSPELPAKMRRREGRSKRPRLTVAEALARVEKRRIILDPDEDSQLVVATNGEEGGPPAPPPTSDSDSDVECTGMEAMQGSALASMYGR